MNLKQKMMIEEAKASAELAMPKKRPRVPTCANCWDKGYSSVLSNWHQAADFTGDISHDEVFEKRNYCPCKKGQKLKKLESKN